MKTILLETANYKTIQLICEDALINHKMIGITGGMSLGKTTSLLAFKQQRQEDVIYVDTYASMTTKLFYSSILKSYCDEILSTSKPINFVIKKLVELFNKTDKNKLLIIDGAGKLTPKMIGYLNEIREDTRQNIGIVLADVEYFKNNIERWKNLGKGEITEFDININSWQELSSPTKEEVIAICEVNGIKDRKVINQWLECPNFAHLTYLIINHINYKTDNSQK
jgi:hypothetical protein